ncbi:efflux RND transporter periplasmic adaptor subunit [Roseibium album]|uniref:Periplasmic multidrug efflux lipoprotein n=1 Tax=Roseibium album TaxID=311410 RepID=A0A0M6ZQB5_9HYPH|nr:efflux RND transporter periplasmic adaptor subunit [Roseibium album]MBG6203484.1 RND family efflux transporter MFP subunit [Labrenzia sp. EL_13]CTQ59382.1 periplasmic multidrug efflux lipoprotein precursor [Roseibium album]CTQ64918.1 periplasmic multidrug efflux lipoprotein precursor [Roseibium album]CTQ74854.1 periplasmic multidrug efflux lipoprotein precursor [Roseibium album]
MRKAIWIVLALVALVGVVLYLETLEDVAEVTETGAEVAPRPVTVVDARIGNHAGTISVFAEVVPRWQVDLRSRVAGIVKDISPLALGGSRVPGDTVLLTLEEAPFLASVEEARHTLKNAEFGLRQKENKRDIALKDWRAVNPDEVPPEMAIHLPEVRVAEQSVAAAEARVGAAEFDLRSTTIRAPFNAIVTKRRVSPGQSVNEGDVLFSLLDDSQLDIRVSLSPNEWRLLAANWEDGRADLFDDAGSHIGTAKVKRGGGFLEPQSRRYQLFLEVDRSAETLALPGQFVRVALQGQQVENTLRIPESALTQNGFVWFVDPADRLQRYEASALFRNSGDVVVKAPDDASTGDVLRIVRLPMSAYLPGQVVAPVSGGQGE